MSLSQVRAGLSASVRCWRARPTAAKAVILNTRRRMSAPALDPRSLETQSDWTEFQLQNAEYEDLIEFYTDYGSTQTRDNSFQPYHPLHRPTAAKNLTMSALLAAGAHLGHSQKLMNTNFLPYAYGVRADITIIDLDHTLPLLRRAAQVVRGIMAKGGTVVFVGTRPDLKPVVRKAAERIGERAYHVGEKWLPGTLTNRVVLFGLETAAKEQIVPDLMILLNPIPNLHAIRECAMQQVPTIGVVDSNVDPRIVMYPIPANDESTRTAELVAGVLSIAGREGMALYKEELTRQTARAMKLQRGREAFVDRS